jgi:hypothetical protein
VGFPASQRCSSRNRFGKPCQAKAIKDGLCAVHSGRSDPVKMGRVGGLSYKETQIRRQLKADEAIRASAREVIHRGLAGDESITKMMLDSARSVFSYRPEVAPQERRRVESTAYKGTTLTEVVRTACEVKALSQSVGGPATDEVEAIETRLLELLAPIGNGNPYEQEGAPR